MFGKPWLALPKLHFWGRSRTFGVVRKDPKNWGRGIPGYIYMCKHVISLIFFIYVLQKYGTSINWWQLLSPSHVPSASIMTGMEDPWDEIGTNG